MKIVCSLLLIFSLLFGTVLPVASAPEEMPPSSLLSLSAQSAVLMCAENREILYEKNANLPLGMASTTKLMTALVVTEQTGAERVISVPPAATGIEGSSIYLSAGEKLTVEELLYALLLSSANDAAVALALTVSPTVEDFCDLMNEKAAELGLTDTHFQNPHGLHHEEHYTTATEMAAILSYALECPLIEDILSSSVAYTFYVKYTVDGEVKSLRSTYYSTLFNTNPEAVSRIKAYEAKMQKKFALNDLELTGGKTGTLGGGSNRIYSLATFADGNGKRYILITGETSLAYGVMTDAKTMYDTYAK